MIEYLPLPLPYEQGKCSSFALTLTWIENFVNHLYLYPYLIWNFLKHIYIYPTDIYFENLIFTLI